VTIIDERRKDRTEREHLPALPVQTSKTEVSGRGYADGPRRDGRGRLFDQIASLIISKERARRRAIWDVPEDDIRLRLRVAKGAARRRGQFAQSAQLAGLRRRRIIRPGSMGFSTASFSARVPHSGISEMRDAAFAGWLTRREASRALEARPARLPTSPSAARAG